MKTVLSSPSSFLWEEYALWMPSVEPSLPSASVSQLVSPSAQHSCSLHTHTHTRFLSDKNISYLKHITVRVSGEVLWKGCLFAGGFFQKCNCISLLSALGKKKLNSNQLTQENVLSHLTRRPGQGKSLAQNGPQIENITRAQVLCIFPPWHPDVLALSSGCWSSWSLDGGHSCAHPIQIQAHPGQGEGIRPSCGSLSQRRLSQNPLDLPPHLINQDRHTGPS